MDKCGICDVAEIATSDETFRSTIRFTYAHMIAHFKLTDYPIPNELTASTNYIIAKGLGF